MILLLPILTPSTQSGRFAATRLSKRRRARVVEARAIDQCLVFGEAKQSRSRISGLRMISDRSRFDKTKTEGGEWLQGDAIFIEAGGETDRIGERQSESL